MSDIFCWIRIPQLCMFLMMLIKLSGGNKITFRQLFLLSDAVQNYEITGFLFFVLLELNDKGISSN